MYNEFYAKKLRIFSEVHDHLISSTDQVFCMQIDMQSGVKQP
jgi:hypothetical protein